jgi:hypothetical protein
MSQALPYGYITLAAARQQLAARLYNSTFWSNIELNLYIAEALSTWNALTSYWRADFLFQSQPGVTWYDLTDPVAMPNTLRPYTTTDQQLYQLLLLHLLEPTTGPVSLQFTTDDLYSAIQRRRDELLSLTSCTQTRSTVGAVAGRITLPDNVIDVRRMAYLPTEASLSVAPPPPPPLITFTLVATQAGATMNYALTSNSLTFPFTSSFSMPVNPVPSGGPIAGGSPFALGTTFFVSNPTGTPGGAVPTSFLVNGSGVTPLLIQFFSSTINGGFQALTNVGSTIQVLVYYLSGSQLYSGPESAPTMLAGTITLNGATVIPSGVLLTQSLATMGYGSGRYGFGRYGISAPVGTLTPSPTVLWPADVWDELSFNSSYLQLPAGTPSTPSTYLMSTQPPLSFDVDTPPSFAGSYELLTVNAGGALDPLNPSKFPIPDDWIHVIKWGVLADLLSRESNSKDMLRAQYAEQRYRMGVAALSSASALLGMRIGNVPLQIDSVRGADTYRTSWQAETPGQPDTILHAGLNLIALAPTPDGPTIPYSLTATVVENAPIPIADGDFIQVSRADLDVLLDYSVHLALFKAGGAEFKSTMSLFERFIKSAALYNQKLSELAEYKSIIYAQSQSEKQMNPVKEETSDVSV